MKLFETKQIAEVDRLTMLYEPIADIDLMERAAGIFSQHIIEETNFNGNVLIFCGPGNNGGDGLAVARHLSSYSERFTIKVFILMFGNELAGSALINFKRLLDEYKIEPVFIKSEKDFPGITKQMFVIDALFGSGLNRPLQGLASDLVRYINQAASTVISLDVPSGLMGEENDFNNHEAIIKSNLTITFQFPKLSFYFAENEKYVGNWLVKDIGLHPKAIDEVSSKFFTNNDIELAREIKPRSKFAHKGIFGHALLISGAYGKMGAAVLAAKACLRSGVGLLTVHVPHLGYQIIQTSIPEAMTSIDESELMFTAVSNIELYNAIGVGPGIGVKVNTKRALKTLIDQAKVPLVIDADALNILSDNKDWLKILQPNTIITPHPKEFDRLFGMSGSAYERLKKAISFSSEYNIIIVLKGAFSQIIEPNGMVWFNTSGNPGMATAGSGDVLTGIILALMAQGYLPLTAARIGVYIHGLAGDIAAARRGYEALIASDIIENLGEAFKLVNK